jgi:hypothetical protein
MITSGNITSAEWIKKNLPGNRVIISNIGQNALKIYSSSIILDVPIEFYFDQEFYQKTIDQLRYKNNNKSFYIYYSKINANNPYIGRPYYKPPSQMQDFIFEKYPDKFKKIYYDQANEIILWKIL